MTWSPRYKVPGVSLSPLGRQSLIQRIGYYGFVECAGMIKSPQETDIGKFKEPIARTRGGLYWPVDFVHGGFSEVSMEDGSQGTA